MKHCKKLIEVALPLEAINKYSSKEKEPFTRNHPRSMHIWWSRKPFAASRAIIFAQLVDDPSAWPDIFPTEHEQDRERQRLFKIIEDLVQWDNTNNEEVLNAARTEILRSWGRACAANVNHPSSNELFNRNILPAFHDPFAGGGALPIEAQRLGLTSYATDLNPVAVLINKAMIEIPPIFSGKPPVNPNAAKDRPLLAKKWLGAQGMADDIRYYGKLVSDEAYKRIGGNYQEVEITTEIVNNRFNPRPDLKQYIGKKLRVIAWLMARAVKSPNPAFSDRMVPLISSFILSSKHGKEVYIEPNVIGNEYRFAVKFGIPLKLEEVKNGTKLARGANFRCILSNSPISSQYIKKEAANGKMDSVLVAAVLEGGRGKVYVSDGIDSIWKQHKSECWAPEIEISGSTQYLGVKPYGLNTFDKLFTNRQLVALNTFSDLVREIRGTIENDAIQSGYSKDNFGLSEGGRGAKAYAEAIAVYLSCATSRWSDLSNTLCTWNHTNQNVRALFARQAIPMSWEYVELSPFSKLGSWYSIVETSADASISLPARESGIAVQADAASQSISNNKVISTDPPYFDNVPYADLSDFFYVWLRKSLFDIFPDIFSTIVVPKNEELVAFSYRHKDKQAAASFFMDGMTKALRQISESSHPYFPITIYYAFKQSEDVDGHGVASTGWETFLEAVIKSGFILCGTWPIRTERGARSRSLGSNALASSIVLVCRPKPSDVKVATRREFHDMLMAELPPALVNMQRGNIAPVDFAQSAIGPGMAIYTRHSSILDASGNVLSVRDALALINQVLDEVLTAQEGDFDADTRWAVTWFEQYGFQDGEAGVANLLANARVTSIKGIVDAGIAVAHRDQVRLLAPYELAADWDPDTDDRLTVWEMTHYLIRALTSGGESAAALILVKLGSKAEAARELAYRLYAICERKKRAQDALNYNALVQSWPEITRLAREGSRPRAGQQGTLLGQE